MKERRFTKKAMALSVCLLLMWVLLGTGTTLAWFTDNSPVIKNSFTIGELELKVSFKNDTVTDYIEMNAATPVFNDEAVYEPGYTQIAYLKIENVGNVDFDYRLSLDMVDCVDSWSTFGLPLHLPDYLRYGVVFSDNDAELERQIARQMADHTFISSRLNQYSGQDITLEPGQVRYAALVVYMPTDVGNAANHHPNWERPKVMLGITVFAQQAGAPMS